MESGFGASTGGRRPILYEKNPAYAYIFGVEISRTLSKLVLVDLGMNKLETKSWAMTESHDPRSTDSSYRRGSAENVSSPWHPNFAGAGHWDWCGGASGPIVRYYSGTLLFSSKRMENMWRSAGG